MNSPFVTEQAKYLAERADDASEPTQFLFRQLLARDATPVELQACKGADPAIVSRTLINSNEFVFLP